MVFVALNSFAISTFNRFYFCKVTGYYSVQRFPAILNFTRDAVLSSHCLKLQNNDLTALHLPHTCHHLTFNNATVSVWNILGRGQCQNTTKP